MVWVQETTYIGPLFHIGFSHPNFQTSPPPIHRQTATMVKKWVNDSFKSILQDNCQAYLESNDLGKHKARTQLINEVAEKIREAAPGSDLPADLNKVCDVEIATGTTPNNLCSLSQSGSEMKQSELSGETQTLARSLKQRAEKTNPESNGTRDWLLWWSIPTVSMRSISNRSRNIAGRVRPIFELTPVPLLH
jgi:hypothetical protein